MKAKASDAEQVVVRQHAERQYAAELATLAESDDRPRPPSWRLSPHAVVTYLLGGTSNGVEITPKYIGDRRIIGLGTSAARVGPSVRSLA